MRPRLRQGILAVIAACLVNDLGASPSGRVTGLITDESGAPIAGALITVTGPGAVGRYDATTDGDGTYRMLGLPTREKLVIRAQAAGKEPVTYSGTLAREGHGTRRDFTLRPAGVYEVLVVLDSRVPYHAMALAAARAELPVDVSVLELTDRRAADARRLENALRSHPNAVLAIGSAAADLARTDIPDAPVVYTMVLEPAAEDLERPNFCGFTLNGGFDRQFEILATIDPGATRVATIFDPRRLGRTVADLRQEARRHGMTLIPRTARTIPQLVSAIEDLEDEQLDAFLLLLDPDLIDIEAFDRIRRFTVERGIVYIVPDRSFVTAGGTYSFAPGFDKMGSHAALLVRRILTGALRPAEIGQDFPPVRYLSLNPYETRRLGITIDEQALGGMIP